MQLELHMPVETPTRTIWRLPHSWTQFEPLPREMAHHYAHHRATQPTSLGQWAQLCALPIFVILLHILLPLFHAGLEADANPGRLSKFRCTSQVAQQALINMLRASTDRLLTSGRQFANSGESKVSCGVFGSWKRTPH